MIKAYKLNDEVIDTLEAIDLYKEYVEDMSEKLNLPVDISKHELEEHMEEKLNDVGLNYRLIKRKNTTSYVIKVKNPESDIFENVKITIRYNDDGNYLSHRYQNITFSRDLDFYL